MNKHTKKVIEDLGWKVISDTCIEIWTDTAGRDVCIECNYPGELKETISAYRNGYDIDEDVELYLQAKRNGLKGVPSASVLVKDCEEVEELYDELWDAVRDLPKF